MAENVECSSIYVCQAPHGARGRCWVQGESLSRHRGLALPDARLRLWVSSFTLLRCCNKASISQAWGAVRGDGVHEASGTK